MQRKFQEELRDESWIRQEKEEHSDQGRFEITTGKNRWWGAEEGQVSFVLATIVPFAGSQDARQFAETQNVERSEGSSAGSTRRHPFPPSLYPSSKISQILVEGLLIPPADILFRIRPHSKLIKRHAHRLAFFREKERIECGECGRLGRAAS